MMITGLARKLLWGVGIIVAITVAAIAFAPDIDVRIPEKTVRSAIDDRIPLEHGSDDGLKTVVRSADVDFVGSGEKGAVKLQADVKMSGFGLAGSGSAKSTTTVRYEDGAFYLTDLSLDDFEVKPSLATRAKLLAWKKVLETFLDEVGEDIRTREGDQALAEFTEHRRLFGPFVLDALDERLGTIPVYRLKGGPAQYAILLALEDVRFTDDEAIATLSPSRAILIIATGLMVILIGGLLAWASISDRAGRSTERPKQTGQTAADAR